MITSKSLFISILFLSTVELFAAQTPDVLLILVDDLRPMLGCYSDPHVKTPNIDRLSQRSVVFEHAYCQYAKCGTSRLSLMTGLRPDAIGVFSNRLKDANAFRRRRSDAVTISKWLKQNGFDARSFGKIDHDTWHVDSDWSQPCSPGRTGEMLEIVDEAFPLRPTIIADRFACPAIQSPNVPDTHLFAGRMTSQVIEELRTRDRTKPYFYAVGFRRPHLPFVAPKKYFDLYQPTTNWIATNQEPARKSPVMAWFNSDGYGGAARKAGLTMPLPPNAEQAKLWNGYELRSYLGIPNRGPIDSTLQQRIKHAYAACVSYVDAQIGRLMEELQKTNRLDKTVIMFCSDHGWHLGEQSAWSKMTNFEIATRVPLMISSPNISPGRTHAIAELVYIYPKLCELLKLPAPKHLQGESLLPVLLGPSLHRGGTAFSQYARYKSQYMGEAVRTDHFRFVRWTDRKSQNPVHLELYDHRNDPHETRNVADQAEFADQIERLQKLLDLHRLTSSTK